MEQNVLQPIPLAWGAAVGSQLDIGVATCEPDTHELHHSLVKHAEAKEPDAPHPQPPFA